jgi:hypothetical protein
VLRLLGVWNLAAAVRALLVLAVVFLVVGFLINVVASVVMSGSLFLVGALVVGAGAACGIAAAVKAGIGSGS